jgi:hypothetical protein
MATSPKIFGFFDLKDEPINPEEAERALRHFIWSVESGYHFSTEKISPSIRVSDELLRFVAKGLKKQLDGSNITAWTGKKAGRPSDDPCDYLSMLTWYRFYLDEEFNKLPKKTGDGGRSLAVAESFSEREKSEGLFRRKGSSDIDTKSDSESSTKHAIKAFQEKELSYKHVSQNFYAEVLSSRAKGFDGMDSESSTKRAIKAFQKEGLSCNNKFRNEYITEVFCQSVLRLHSRDEITLYSQQIIEFWKKNKGQK